ncbi:MAG: polyphenol oxidase family protein [Candidatus Ratteibacteria bacterium]|nr:polyphenol oxidase family protein [Candidatus Ratteibacteria bacterium]
MKHSKIFPKLGLIEFSPLRNFPEIIHGFTTRELGNTALHVATTQDKLNKAIKNREIVCRTFRVELDRLVTSQQVHGDRVVPVNLMMRGMGSRVYSESIPNCDGLITNYEQLPLAIFVADCLPLYIYAYQAKAIGLIHAGKAGTQLEIARKAVEKMESEYHLNPKECIALLGPAIGPCCIERDLYNLNRKQLCQAGLLQENIYSVDTCTSCQNQVFYSYHREREKAGRMMAFFMLK